MLHYLDAEMDEIAVPGILAYKGGDCFANLVSIVDEIPDGKDFSAAVLEGMLQQYVHFWKTRERIGDHADGLLRHNVLS